MLPIVCEDATATTDTCSDQNKIAKAITAVPVPCSLSDDSHDGGQKASLVEGSMPTESSSDSDADLTQHQPTASHGRICARTLSSVTVDDSLDDDLSGSLGVSMPTTLSNQGTVLASYNKDGGVCTGATAVVSTTTKARPGTMGQGGDSSADDKETNILKIAMDAMALMDTKVADLTKEVKSMAVTIEDQALENGRLHGIIGRLEGELSEVKAKHKSDMVRAEREHCQLADNVCNLEQAVGVVAESLSKQAVQRLQDLKDIENKSMVGLDHLEARVETTVSQLGKSINVLHEHAVVDNHKLETLELSFKSIMNGKDLGCNCMANLHAAAEMAAHDIFVLDKEIALLAKELVPVSENGGPSPSAPVLPSSHHHHPGTDTIHQDGGKPELAITRSANDEDKLLEMDMHGSMEGESNNGTTTSSSLGVDLDTASNINNNNNKNQHSKIEKTGKGEDPEDSHHDTELDCAQRKKNQELKGRLNDLRAKRERLQLIVGRRPVTQRELRHVIGTIQATFEKVNEALMYNGNVIRTETKDLFQSVSGDLTAICHRLNDRLVDLHMNVWKLDHQMIWRDSIFPSDTDYHEQREKIESMKGKL